MKKFIPKDKEKQRVVENFFSLSVLQVGSSILPLITVPYLVRVLGPTKFGLIAFAQAFVYYFIIIQGYGFNLSTTQRIALFRENKEKVCRIFTATMIGKTILCGIGGIIFLSLLVFVNKFRQDASVYILSFGTVIGELLFPIYVFQGVERMIYITILTLIGRIIYTGGIFLVVRTSEDYLLSPLLNSLSTITIGIAGIWILHRKLRIKFKKIKYKDVKEELREGLELFIARIATGLYTTTNTFILGLVTTTTYVGYYAGVEKIIFALKRVISVPVVQSTYPYISKKVNSSPKEGVKFIKMLVIIVGIGTFIISLILFLFAKLISNIILGPQYTESIIVLKILAPIIFITAIASVFGMNTMLPFKLKKEFSKILVWASLLNIILILILGSLFKHKGAALSMVIVESFILITMAIYIYRRGIKVI